MYTLSDLDYVPQAVGTDSRYERFSTDRSDCRLSFAAPAGLLLGHPHIYNQYVFWTTTPRRSKASKREPAT